MTESEIITVPAVIGHRGAAGHAPENTLASLRKAAELGVRWVEFDTKLTRDGAAVLFHDHTLERTTDGRGEVAETALADLRERDAGTWFDVDSPGGSRGAFAGERVPTLLDAMETLARLGLGAIVEIKPSPGRAAETGRVVAGVLKSSWPATLPAPLISSFDREALAAALEAAPNIHRALNLLKIPWGWRKQVKALDCRAIHCLERKLTAKRVGAFKDEGLVVRAFTVNDRDRAETLFGWGVHGVISDYPERILASNPSRQPMV